MFISYRRVDEQKKFAKKFVEQLRKQNITVWIDDDGIAAGERLDEILAENIIKHDIFVCVLSDKYFESDFCQSELDFAHNLKKKVFPIKWNDSTLPPAFIFNYGHICRHTYNPQAENLDAELQKCVDEFMKLAESKLYTLLNTVIIIMCLL